MDLNTLTSLFKSELQLSHIPALLSHLGNVLNVCREEFLIEGNARNGVIDAICDILQKQKVPLTAQTTQEKV
jgi:hypothetical protein